MQPRNRQQPPPGQPPLHRGCGNAHQAHKRAEGAPAQAGWLPGKEQLPQRKKLLRQALRLTEHRNTPPPFLEAGCFLPSPWGRGTAQRWMRAAQAGGTRKPRRIRTEQRIRPGLLRTGSAYRFFMVRLPLAIVYLRFAARSTTPHQSGLRPASFPKGKPLITDSSCSSC